MKKFFSPAYMVLVVLTFTMASGSGCGGRDPNRPRLVPATGRVTLAGKPLAGAVLTFVPTGATRGSGAEARTDPQGRYELASQHGRGAAVGSYRVIIRKWVMPDGSDYVPEAGVGPEDSPARQVLPPRYSDFQQTTLTATIPEGGSSTLDFALTP